MPHRAMATHHQQAIEAFVQRLADEGEIDAIIVAGSVGRGTARQDSDIDVYLVAPDDIYQRRRLAGALGYYSPCAYPGGYIDGKVVSIDMLRTAAERGAEPMRASFLGAQVVYSRVGALQPLIERIGVYPEANREANMRDFFVAMSLHARYFGPQAVLRDDPFLASHAAAQAVLFGGRAILAYNRMLFPCAKQLLGTLDLAPEKPRDLVELSRTLTKAPSAHLFAEYNDALVAFTDWRVTPHAGLTRFLELEEWRWLDDEPELAQR